VNGFCGHASGRVQCHTPILDPGKLKEDRMRTLAKAAVALSLVGATAIGTAATVQAQGFYIDAPGIHVGVGVPYYHHRYYNYYGGYRTWNGCPPDWTIQGGVCKPYHHGPWDWNPYYR
jgi:hypothetical protein